MSDQFDEKVFEPTPRRRQQARAEGRIPRSTDLTSAGILLGGLIVLVATGGTLIDYMGGLLTDSLGGQAWMHWTESGQSPSSDALTGQWTPIMAGLAKVLLPPLVLVALLAIALNVVQTGVVFLPGKLAPDTGRLNPLAGIRRVFSASSSVRLTLGLVKLATIVAVAFASMYQNRAELASVGTLQLPHLLAFVWEFCLWTGLKIGSALMILAVADYAFERWRHERDLRMTPQEMRDEMRSMQGDPQAASRRRAQQQAVGRAPRSERV